MFDQPAQEADLMDILGAGFVDAGVLLDGQDDLAAAPECLVERGLQERPMKSGKTAAGKGTKSRIGTAG